MFKKFLLNPFVFFSLVTLVVFWPLTFQLFTLKNDTLTYYYPIRTLISDALNNHELPLWTPYLNLGYPIHADMQSGAWNPIIWIFSFFTRYSLASFHYELLLYACFAGIGFYYLCKEYGWSKTTAFTLAIAYELSGFMIDSMQFTVFISSACFIPFIFLFFRRIFIYQRWTDALAAAFFLYLLFTGGYPSFFIITAYILLAWLLFYFFNTDNKIRFIKKVLSPLMLVIVGFTLLSLPAIISFTQLLEHIERGKKQGLDFVLENSMAAGSIFSLISPFSTTAPTAFQNTDLLMRNMYIGIVPLFFLLSALFNRSNWKNKEVKFYLITAFILLGMALGSHFFLRQLAYYILPLMNTFRHPSSFRMFVIIFFLLTAGFTLDKWQNDKINFPKKLIVGFGIAVLLSTIFIAFVPFTKSSSTTFTSANLKNILTQLSFQQRYLIQLPFIIAVVCIFYFIVDKKIKAKYLMLLTVADMFFATQLNMPVTVIGAKKFTAMETFLNRAPVKFPSPGTSTIEENSVNSFDSSNTVGSRLIYEKKVGRNDYYITPGNLSLQDKFYESAIKIPVLKNQLIYFADTVIKSNTLLNDVKTNGFAIVDSLENPLLAYSSHKGIVAATNLSANKIECITENDHAGLLVCLQNNYPGWKVFVDGKEVVLYTANISFMAAQIPAGKHTIVFSYSPKIVIYAWYISMLALLVTLVLLLRRIFS